MTKKVARNKILASKLLLLLLLLLYFFFTRGRYDPSGGIIVIITITRPVERGGEAGKNSRAPSSHGGLELSALLTHGGPLGFELQTKVHKNKFLLISRVISIIGLSGPLLVLMGPRLQSSPLYRYNVPARAIVYKCIKHRVLYLSL